MQVDTHNSFSLQARKVETRCAYLLNAQTVLERMNPW
jgi:hypothetical protein